MLRRIGTERLTIVATLTLLFVANFNELWLNGAFNWLGVGVAVCLLLYIAFKGGLNFGDIGLSKRTVIRGFQWGLAATAVIALVMIITFTINQNVFLDSRYHNSIWRAVISTLFIIPLHTVVIEELAFRGVLWASLMRVVGVTKATIISSIVFGLWHIVPSLHLNHSSDAISSVVGGSLLSQLLVVGGTVIVTTFAGVAFCELRRRSDSLIAPIMAHWTINGVAVLLAALAWAK